MAAPRKYPDDLHERATRMAVEARQNAAARDGAIALKEPTELLPRAHVKRNQSMQIVTQNHRTYRRGCHPPSFLSSNPKAKATSRKPKPLAHTKP